MVVFPNPFCGPRVITLMLDLFLLLTTSASSGVKRTDPLPDRVYLARG